MVIRTLQGFPLWYPGVHLGAVFIVRMYAAETEFTELGKGIFERYYPHYSSLVDCPNNINKYSNIEGLSLHPNSSHKNQGSPIALSFLC